jgi:hypothetical protein
MFLAGIPIRHDLILELAGLVDEDDLADRLLDCCRRDVNVLVHNPSTSATVAIVTTRCGNDVDFLPGMLPLLYPH